ncbi:separase [Entamoeba marina]
MKLALNMSNKNLFFKEFVIFTEKYCHLHESLVNKFSSINHVNKEKFVAKSLTSFQLPDRFGVIVIKMLRVNLSNNQCLQQVTSIIQKYYNFLKLTPTDIIQVYYKASYGMFKEQKYYEARNLIQTYFGVRKLLFPTYDDPLMVDCEKIVVLSSKQLGFNEDGFVFLCQRIKKWDQPSLNEKFSILKEFHDVFSKATNATQCCTDFISSLTTLPKNLQTTFVVDLLDYELTFRPESLLNLPTNHRLILIAIARHMQKYFTEKKVRPFEVLRFEMYELVTNFSKETPFKLSKLIERIKEKEASKMLLKSSRIAIYLTLSECYYFTYIYHLYNSNFLQKPISIMELMKSLSYIATISDKCKTDTDYPTFGITFITLLSSLSSLFELYGDDTNRLKSLQVMRESLSNFSLTEDERIMCLLKIITCYIDLGYYKYAGVLLGRIRNNFSNPKVIEGEQLTLYILYLITTVANSIAETTTEDPNISATLQEIEHLIDNSFYQTSSTQWESTVLYSKYHDVASLYTAKIGQFNLAFQHSKYALSKRKSVTDKFTSPQPTTIKLHTKSGSMLFYSIYSFTYETIQSFLQYGWLYEIRNSHREASLCYTDAEKIANTSNSVLLYSLIKSEIGELYIKTGDFEQAKQSFEEIEKILGMIKKIVSVKRPLIFIFIRLGDLYKKTKHIRNALEYYRNADSIIDGLLKKDVLEPFPVVYRDSTHREYLVRQSLDGKLTKISPERLTVPSNETTSSTLYKQIRNRILYKIIKISNIGNDNISTTIAEYTTLLDSPFNSPITTSCILNQLGIAYYDNNNVVKAKECFQRALSSAVTFGVPTLLHDILHNLICTEPDSNISSYYHFMSIGISFRQRFPTTTHIDYFSHTPDITLLLRRTPISWKFACISFNERTNTLHVSSANKTGTTALASIVLRGGTNNSLTQSIQRLHTIHEEIKNIFTEVKNTELDAKTKRVHWRRVYDVDKRIGEVVESLSKTVLSWARILLKPIPPRTSIHDSQIAKIFPSIRDFSLLYHIATYHSSLTDDELLAALTMALATVPPSSISSYRRQLQSLKLPSPPTQTVLLLLDKKLHELPWESISTYSKLSITRIPTFDPYVTSNLIQFNDTTPSLTITPSRGYYVLNPSGDLPRTEERLVPYLKRLRWKGIAQEIPQETEFLRALENNDILLYSGHGGGEQFIPGKKIQELARCGAALIMGCRSVALTQVGDFEPYGLPFDYLLAGSPVVVGNLWNVPDTELDKVTQFLLDWLLEGDNTDISMVVNRAKKTCELKWLMGAALVCYGFPVTKKKKRNTILVLD